MRRLLSEKMELLRVKVQLLRYWRSRVPDTIPTSFWGESDRFLIRRKLDEDAIRSEWNASTSTPALVP